MTHLSERQQLGRAKNVLSTYLTRKLEVPKIYLDATWNEQPVDVLAIDRAGVGDVHAARMVLREPNPVGREAESVRTILDSAESFTSMHTLPSQYRYSVIVSNLSYRLEGEMSVDWKNQTFAEDGVGRIGILYIDLTADDPRVEEIIKPERFRSTRQILDLTDEYVAQHTANMEYRDPTDFGVHA